MRIPLLWLAVLLVLAAGRGEPLASREVPDCAACGGGISGDYFETRGEFYHRDCFVCGQCGKPITGPYIVHKEKNYHTKCFERDIALKCDVCGGVIKGQYLVNFWGNAYHPKHMDEILKCDFCNRLIVGKLVRGTVRFDDGRHLCGHCRPSAVTRVEDAGRLVAEVSAELEGFGLTVDPGRLELRLVDQDELTELAAGRSSDTKGFTDYTVKKNLFGRVRGETILVYLLYGMPEVQMKSTIAHELCHVWQFTEGRLDQDPLLAEGSANFASYLVMRKEGSQAAKYIIDNMMHDDDPAYGEGFRKVKKYVEKNGLKKWLRLLAKKHRRPPL